MPQQDGERTEEATPKRKQKAIEEGNVAKSREFATSVIFITSIIFLYYYVPVLMHGLEKIMVNFFNLLSFKLTSKSVYLTFIQIVNEIGKLLMPFFAILLAASIFANVLQTGFIFTPKAIEPKLSKINPISGFARIFSKKSLVELIKSIIKIFVVGFIAWSVIDDKVDVITSLTTSDPKTIVIYLGKLIFEISFKVAILLVIVALADFLFQKWQWTQELKMTKQEVKEEFKQMEGDPLIKRRIRNLQIEMARQRMMSEIPESDVVITNPTHYAVAIKYEMGKDVAPKVVAKGQRLVALKIKELAKEHNVIVHEDPPLARTLYSSVDIGENIPENLYKAVAEILAFVYKIRNKS